MSQVCLGTMLEGRRVVNNVKDKVCREAKHLALDRLRQKTRCLGAYRISHFCTASYHGCQCGEHHWTVTAAIGTSLAPVSGMLHAYGYCNFCCKYMRVGQGECVICRGKQEKDYVGHFKKPYTIFCCCCLWVRLHVGRRMHVKWLGNLKVNEYVTYDDMLYIGQC